MKKVKKGALSAKWTYRCDGEVRSKTAQECVWYGLKAALGGYLSKKWVLHTVSL